MNTLFSLNGRTTLQSSNLLTAVENRNKAVLFVMGVALTLSTALFAKSFKPQDIQQSKQSNKKFLSKSSHSNLIPKNSSRETNDGQKKVSQKYKNKKVCKSQNSAQNKQSLVINLKELLEQAESAEKNTFKSPKQKSPTTSINELIETQRNHTQGRKILQGQEINEYKQMDIEDNLSIAQLPPFFITEQEIDEKRRSINSRKVNDWRISEKNAIKEMRQLRKLY